MATSKHSSAGIFPQEIQNTQWNYVGDEVVGVVTDCDCLETAVGQYPGGGDILSTLHESHDVVRPLFESELPEGVTMDTWRQWMKLIATAPRMLALFEECDEYLSPNPQNYIGHGSLLHTEMRRLIAEAKGGTRFQLNSAVPDLLKSCETLVKAMHDYQLDVDEEPPYKHTTMMRDALDAIAKVKGLEVARVK